MELPTCKHRISRFSNDNRYGCRSPFLHVGASGVTGAFCSTCKYADRDLPDELLTLNIPVIPKPEAIPIGGVGTELTTILSSIGINPSNCRCKERASLMNGWGLEGCREKKDEIVAWLRGEYKRVGWATVLAAVTKAIATGLAFRLSITDPVPDLVEEAIRRAEEKSRRV